MFPIGGIVGGLLAANRRVGPTKARVVGEKYVMQARPGSEAAASAVLWGLLFPMALLAAFTQKKAADAHAILLSMSILNLALSPLLLAAYGRHYVFDEDGIEAIAPWHKPRRLRYRELFRVRRSITGDGIVLRSWGGVFMTIPDSFGGWLTLAHQILVTSPKKRR